MVCGMASHFGFFMRIEYKNRIGEEEIPCFLFQFSSELTIYFNVVYFQGIFDDDLQKKKSKSKMVYILLSDNDIF